RGCVFAPASIGSGAFRNSRHVSGNRPVEVSVQARTGARTFWRNRRALISSLGGYSLVAGFPGAWARGSRRGLAHATRGLATNRKRARQPSRRTWREDRDQSAG